MYKLRYTVFAGVLFYFQKTVHGLWRFVLFFLLVTSMSNIEFKLMTPRLRVSCSIYWVNQVTLVFEILMLGIFFFSLVVSSLLVWLLPSPHNFCSFHLCPQKESSERKGMLGFWTYWAVERNRNQSNHWICQQLSINNSKAEWERW